MDNMIFTSEVCGVVLIAPFDKISRPPCSTIRFIVFLSLFFRCFSPFSFYHRTFSLTTRNEVTKDTVKHALVPLSVNCRGPLGPCATLVTSWFRKQVAYSPQACLASLSAASLYSSPVCAFTLRKESLNGKSFTASRYPRDSAVLARQLPLAQHSMPA